MKFWRAVTIVAAALVLFLLPFAAFSQEQGSRLNRAGYQSVQANVAPEGYPMPAPAPPYGATAPLSNGNVPTMIPAAGFAQAGSRSNGGDNWVDSFSTPPPAVNAPPAASNFRQDPTTVRIKPPASHPMTAGVNQGISQTDLRLLQQHDVAVIVDRSLSMTTQDCPGFSGIAADGGWQQTLLGIMGTQMPGFNVGSHGGLSRWQFVQQQAMALAKQTESIFPQGITLVLFSSHVRVFRNVDLRAIPQIFAENHPWGSTNTAEALAEPIRDYLSRRDAQGNVKPLAIAVVTDGMPTNPDAVRRLIIETTQRLRNPHEISITFLLIGTEREGFDLVKELDNNLVYEGAKFDIVDSKSFPEVIRAGLARSLVDAISKNH